MSLSDVSMPVEKHTVPKLQAKYMKFALFALWLSKKQSCAAVADECKFNNTVELQTAFYAEFEAAEKDLRKEYTKLNKPDKVKKPRASKKNTIQPTPREDLMTELVRLASSEDLPTTLLDTNLDNSTQVKQKKTRAKKDNPVKNDDSHATSHETSHKLSKKTDKPDKAEKEALALAKKAQKEAAALAKKSEKEAAALAKKLEKDSKKLIKDTKQMVKPTETPHSNHSDNPDKDDDDNDNDDSIDAELFNIDGVDFALDTNSNKLYDPNTSILLGHLIDYKFVPL
jgi:hypothetical protein